MFGDRYRIVCPIGRGGMGTVYQAEDLKLGQAVALKFLPRELAGDQTRLNYLYAEVRNARLISHPNVCRVHDIGEYEGRTFLSMEYVDGEDLASLLKRIGRLPAQKAMETAHEICAGLAAAHDKGVIHRDLKPANIMIDGSGQARIMDFGLAVSPREGDQQKGAAGTLSYMAPEQWAGRGSTVRSDIYSLGLVLYEIITGHRPFEASTAAEIHRKQTMEAPVPPSAHIPYVDPAVEGVILRCLAKDPEARPASALEVAASLPGGDPLQAAIAAGRTPSPEMVAAAGAKGSLKPLIAWGILGLFLVFLALSVMLASRSFLLGAPGFKKNPEVLAEKCRELIEKFGFRDTPKDRVFWFEADESLINWLSQKKPKIVSQGRIPEIKERLVRFRYRQSPERLVTSGNQGFVKENNPPLDVPGMVNIDLDAEGRLLRFLALPAFSSASPESSAAPDWNALFAAAGLDIKSFSPEAAKDVPPLPFDRRESWTGVLSREPAVPLRVVGAAFQGKPVFFEVRGPWDDEASAVTFHSRLTHVYLPAVWFPTLFLILIIGIFFARRNIRMKRGDARAAFRISAFAFVALAFGSALWTHHVYGTFGDFMWWIRSGLAFFLFDAAFVWVCYMAIEPAMRRTWPQQMISWNRLLSGRFRDPLVGRDILIGVAFGTATAAAMFILKAFPGWMFLPGSWTAHIELFSLFGAFKQLGTVSYLIGITMFYGVGWMAAIVIPYIFFRNKKPVIAVCVVFGAVNFIVGTSGYLWGQILFGCIASIGLAVCLFRFGIFSAAVAFFIQNLLTRMPLRLEAQNWSARAALMTIAVVVVVALYGFYVSLGGRPLFGRLKLDD